MDKLPADLERIFRVLKEAMYFNLLKDGYLVPVCIIVQKNKQSIIVPLEFTKENKEEVINKLKAKLRTMDIYAVFLICEGRVLASKENEKSNVALLSCEYFENNQVKYYNYLMYFEKENDTVINIKKEEEGDFKKGGLFALL